ncbi:MAG: hypothetical protein M1823_004522 [Watsoniomyces obsoletus]|nr:MAG: hypothetical protein M1823_004522 [Watsoniomyces obsoletus]
MPLVKQQQQHQLVPRQSCPAGTSFYACGSPEFRGCCSVDACTARGCPDQGGRSSPRPSTSRAGNSSERSTRTRDRENASATNPPRVPTSSGAPLATVTITESRVLGGGRATRTITPSNAAAAGATVTTTLLGAGPSDIPQSGSGSSTKSKSKAGPIAGGAVGVVVLLAALAFLYFCCWRPRRRERRARKGHMPLPSGGREIIEDGKNRLRASSLISTLPSPERPLLQQSPELDSRPVSTVFELPGSAPPAPQDPSEPRTSTSRSRLFPPPRSFIAGASDSPGRGRVDSTVQDERQSPGIGSGDEGDGGDYRISGISGISDGPVSVSLDSSTLPSRSGSGSGGSTQGIPSSLLPGHPPPSPLSPMMMSSHERRS